MRKPILFLFFISLTIWFSSCVTAKKQIYFQNLKGSTDTISSTINDSLINSVVIQPYDRLDISIKPMDKALQDLTQNQTSGSNFGVTTNLNNNITGFLVDAMGNVNLPVIGEVTLKGLTIRQARFKLAAIMRKVYQSDPFVDIKFLTFSVTLLGEINHPGKTIVSNEKANLIDVIAQSGDLTDMANRQTIKIIRGDPRKPVVYLVDLTNTLTFNSPGFILQPNDIVYIEPFPKKFLFANLNQAMPFITIANTLFIILSLLGVFARR